MNNKLIEKCKTNPKYSYGITFGTIGITVLIGVLNLCELTAIASDVAAVAVVGGLIIYFTK